MYARALLFSAPISMAKTTAVAGHSNPQFGADRRTTPLSLSDRLSGSDSEGSGMHVRRGHGYFCTSAVLLYVATVVQKEAALKTWLLRAVLR